MVFGPLKARSLLRNAVGATGVSRERVIQRCMSFTEKIVVGQISGKVMHSGKVVYIAFIHGGYTQ